MTEAALKAAREALVVLSGDGLYNAERIEIARNALAMIDALACDEIDRLRAALAESERLKEKAALEYVGAIAERDRARAEALEEARKIAKTAWLSDVGVIGDADYGEALCAAIDEGIRSLASAGAEKGQPNA